MESNPRRVGRARSARRPATKFQRREKVAALFFDASLIVCARFEYLFHFSFIALSLLIVFLSRRNMLRCSPRNALFFRHTRQFPIHVTSKLRLRRISLSRMPSSPLGGQQCRRRIICVRVRIIRRINSLVCVARKEMRINTSELSRILLL